MNLSSYSLFIVQKLLQLRNGDALSINTEEISFQFAKEVANCALKITNFPVKIVLTENGRPLEVTDFEPDGVFSKNTGLAMLRINYVKEEANEENSLNVVVEKEDLATCQKLGHLAEPVELERRIAVPYCVVPFYSGNDERWLKVEKSIKDFDSDFIITKYRKQNLEHLDIHTLHYIGENTDFTVTLPEDESFISNLINLSNGRAFNNSIYTTNLFTVAERLSLNGKFKARTKVFGKNVVVEVKAQNGNLSFVNDSFELKELLSFDEKLSQIGYISFSDKHFSLFLGGSPVDPILEIINKQELLPDYFNDSLYSLELKLEENLSIYAIDCEGKETEIVRKGFFLD